MKSELKLKSTVSNFPLLPPTVPFYLQIQSTLCQ